MSSRRKATAMPRLRPMYGRGRHGEYATATIREALEAVRGLAGLFVPRPR